MVVTCCHLSIEKQSHFRKSWHSLGDVTLLPLEDNWVDILYTVNTSILYQQRQGVCRLKVYLRHNCIHRDPKSCSEEHKAGSIHTVDGAENIYQSHKTIRQMGWDGEWWGETEISSPTGPVTSTELYQKQLDVILRAAVLGGISIFIQFVWPWHLLRETLVICKY